MLGGRLSDEKKPSPFAATVGNLDADVSRYETMPAAEVQAELRSAGIDPAPTIAAVEKLVRARLEAWKQHHRPALRRVASPSPPAPSARDGDS